MTKEREDKQSRLIERILAEREDRNIIAQKASVTRGQVSAIAAHRTMRKREPLADPQIAETETDSISISTEALSDQRASIPLGTDMDTGRPDVWDSYASSNTRAL